MTHRAFAWVLNLDVESELADPRGYTRGRGVETQLRAALSELRASGLIRDHDLVVDPPVDTNAADAARLGQCWCPTPRALDRLRAAGVTPPHAPSLEILQRVNDRRFAIEIDPGPLETRYVDTLDDLLPVLESGSTPWVLKRGLSFAGRGHRRLLEPFGDEDRRWCENSFRQGWGIAVEPWVERSEDFAQHGWVSETGEVTLGRPMRQHCDAHGAWRGPVVGMPLDLSAEETRALESSAATAGKSLAAAGYFGPFGVDAFRYRRNDRVDFNPMCEINARYSMAWARSGLTPGR